MKIQIGFISLLLALGACTANQDRQDIVGENFDFASSQLKHAFVEIDSAKTRQTEEQKARFLSLPRNIQPDGSLGLVDPNDWTSGFFPGSLWYMYEYTKDDYWKQKAEYFTAPIEQVKTDGSTHDMGFKVYCSFGNGYRLTGNGKYKDIMLEAAATLATRYKDKMGCVRSWDFKANNWQYPVIIDNMMNLELLFWAFEASQDSTYYHIAVNHARTTMKNHFREDYSSYHVVDYDTLTGAVRHKQTHQGCADSSAWARGQAWGLYGYTMCYRKTGLPEFLEQAKHIARFVFTNKNMPQDLIPYWDYDAPNIPNESRDASAAAIAACALYELCMYDEGQAGQYKEWADGIIKSLTESYRAKPNGDRGFLLLHSTGAASYNSEVDVPINYADYYFLEALLKKAKLEAEGTAVL